MPPAKNDADKPLSVPAQPKSDPAAGPAPVEKAPPPFGAPKQTEYGEIPRVVDPLVRAPAGLKRYKVRCENYDSRFKNAKYILAEDELQARDCFAKESGLMDQIGRMKADGIDVVKPQLIVTALKD